MDSAIYTAYCSAFDQLLEIADNDPELVSEGRLEDIKLKMADLDSAFAKLQEKYKDAITQERLKARMLNAYTSKANRIGYDKNS